MMTDAVWYLVSYSRRCRACRPRRGRRAAPAFSQDWLAFEHPAAWALADPSNDGCSAGATRAGGSTSSCSRRARYSRLRRSSTRARHRDHATSRTPHKLGLKGPRRRTRRSGLTRQPPRRRLPHGRAARSRADDRRVYPASSASVCCTSSTRADRDDARARPRGRPCRQLRSGAEQPCPRREDFADLSGGVLNGKAIISSGRETADAKSDARAGHVVVRSPWTRAATSPRRRPVRGTFARGGSERRREASSTDDVCCHPASLGRRHLHVVIM